MSSFPPPPPAYGETPAQYQQQGEPPIYLPYYGAPLRAAVNRFFKKYATFSGRASRSEFWWWYLVSAIVSILFNLLITAVNGGHSTMMSTSSGQQSMTAGASVVSGIEALWGLAILIPGLALFWRRMHDANHSGLWIFIALIPFIGWIVLLVFAVQGPKPEGQRFDKDGAGQGYGQPYKA